MKKTVLLFATMLCSLQVAYSQNEPNIEITSSGININSGSEKAYYNNKEIAVKEDLLQTDPNVLYAKDTYNNLLFPPLSSTWIKEGENCWIPYKSSYGYGIEGINVPLYTAMRSNYVGINIESDYQLSFIVDNLNNTVVASINAYDMSGNQISEILTQNVTSAIHYEFILDKSTIPNNATQLRVVFYSHQNGLSVNMRNLKLVALN